MNEALLSGLPVFMTNVSPNNQILPQDWLVESDSIGTIRTKVRINLLQSLMKYPIFIFTFLML